MRQPLKGISLVQLLGGMAQPGPIAFGLVTDTTGGEIPVEGGAFGVNIGPALRRRLFQRGIGQCSQGCEGAQDMRGCRDPGRGRFPAVDSSFSLRS